jgi:hypothetical protein
VIIPTIRSTLIAVTFLVLAARAEAQTALRVSVSADSAASTDALVTLVQLSDTTIRHSLLTDTAGVAWFRNFAAARYRLIVERAGYATTVRDVRIAAGSTTRVDVELHHAAYDLPGLSVATDRRRARFQESAGASASELSQKDLKLLPALGESDVLRAVDVLPGVVSTSDFSSAFNVRGGGADQNLILLDGLPIYNPFHLGGLFSVFNADMVNRAELLSGGFPAQYGGRVSSVLNVESQAEGTEADSAGLDVQGGVSLLATRVALGVKLPRDVVQRAGLASGRARLSMRRSYFDQILKPVFDFPYHLTDIQLFAEGISPGGGRITLTGYTGRDVLNLAGLDSFPLAVRWNWGNDVIGSTWTVPLAGGRRVETRLGYSRFATDLTFPDFGDTEISSRIQQALFRTALSGSWRASQWSAGVSTDWLSYRNVLQSGGTTFGQGADRGWMLGAFAQQALRKAEWLVETGVRVDSWQPHSGFGRAVVQPRLAVKHFIGAEQSVAVKAAVGRYAQFAQSLRDEELPLGIDAWVLSGERAPAVVSDQVQTGIEAFLRGKWYTSLEGYYRVFNGVVSNNPGEDPDDPVDDLLRGTGVSYGADIQVRRDAGRVRPMLAMSWLKATREFDDINVDPKNPPKTSYPPIFDRRLDVDLVLQVMLPREWQMGVRWNLGTGLPYTRPVGSYSVYDYSLLTSRYSTSGSSDTSSAVLLGARNGERYPVYHRLDASLHKSFAKSWGTITPSIDILNIYNRKNVLFYFFDYTTSPATRAGVSMFPFLPTVGMEIHF